MYLSSGKSAVRGFTLIELLVVIAIIGVLIAMLVPVLGNARAVAQQAGCSSNLRQIGIGYHAYAEDFKRRIPHSNKTTLTVNGWSATAATYGIQPWGVYVWPYVGETMEVFLDPGHYGLAKAKVGSTDVPTTGIKGMEAFTWDNYCENQDMTASASLVMQIRILDKYKTPSQTGLIIDGGIYGMGFIGNIKKDPITSPSYIVPGAHLTTTGTSPMSLEAITQRHPDKSVNMLFFDAHVERFNARVLNKRANAAVLNDPIWTRGF